tara:strand:+ start:4639 stop:5214 length:576 start_codon:yes stop_codon:yes gene_type:complete
VAEHDQPKHTDPVPPATVVDFWFETLSARDWYRKSQTLDQLISARFGATLRAARAGKTADWRATPTGRLAEIIVLDQFSRNIHRDSARAFENDGIALTLARDAIASRADQQLTRQQCAFLYMPFMHSEALDDHETAQELYDGLGLTSYITAEQKHRAIIERFGRYPHRNALLGRQNTADEAAFLKEPGSSF